MKTLNVAIQKDYYMSIWHLMGFKRIFIGIVIPILGALMIGASFLPLGLMRDVLLAVGGAFVGQIISLIDYITELKNKISEAIKKARAAFLLGCDMGPFFMISPNDKVPRDIVDKAYRHITTELEVLRLSTAEDLLDLLKETVGKPVDDVLKNKIVLAVESTTEILATAEPPLHYIFNFGMKFAIGQVALVHMDVKYSVEVLQLLEDYSKNIRNNELYSDFYKEVIDKAIKMFMEEIDKKNRGELKMSDIQKASDFIEDIRISLHPS
jgi:hypothetical protein